MDNNQPQTLCWLLGAGTSIPAGLPSTNQITDSILTSEDIFRHTNGEYYIGIDAQQAKCKDQEEIRRLIRQYLESLIRHWKTSHAYLLRGLPPEPNYEEIYYLAEQIKEYHTGEIENHALFPFYKIIMEEAQKMVAQSETSWAISYLFSESCNFITDIVCGMLGKYQDADKLGYLDFLLDALNLGGYIKHRILTLNHDRVLDAFLKKNKIEYSDGFVQFEEGICQWSPKTILEKNISLLALHGAISWRYFRQGNGEIIFTKYDGPHLEIYDACFLTDKQILIGSFNKPVSYTIAWYFDLFSSMWIALNECKRMVISGYSFRDRNINIILFNWLSKGPDRQILAIHGNPPELISKSGCMMRLRETKQIKFLSKCIQNVSWPEIKSALE